MQTKLTEIDAFIYGQKIGTLIYHQGAIYFEYVTQGQWCELIRDNHANFKTGNKSM